MRERPWVLRSPSAVEERPLSPSPCQPRPARAAARARPSAPSPRLGGVGRVLLGALLVAGLGGAPSARAASGVTVRLSTDEPMTDPVVELDDAGHPTTMQLKDDGQQPDVIAGDGTWAATAISSGGEMGITLRSGSKSWSTRSEAYPMGNGPRDLDLTLSAGVLVATPRLAGSVAPTPVDGGPPKEGAPGGQGAPNGGDPGQPGVGPGGSRAGLVAQRDDNGPLLIGLGVGLLAMAVLGWRAFGRGDSSAASAVPGARRQAQAPALGTIGPSLSEGLALVEVAAEVGAEVEPDAEAKAAAPGGPTAPVLGLLVQTLAEHYRVLVVISDEVPLPPLRGAIWRVDLEKAAQIGDAAEALEALPGAPVVVVLLGPPAEALATLTEQLPETIGGLLICPAPAEASPDALRLRLGPDGLRAAWREASALLPFDASGGLQLALR